MAVTPLEFARTTLTTDPALRYDAKAPVAVVRGRVEHGDARGRLLGFPTANISVPETHMADGVWAAMVRTRAKGPELTAAVSIGRRTTFYGNQGERLLEAHVLDVDLSLYGQLLEVHLYRRLRPQRRFDDVDALIAQMHQDVVATREWARSRLAVGRSDP